LFPSTSRRNAWKPWKSEEGQSGQEEGLDNPILSQVATGGTINSRAAMRPAPDSKLFGKGFAAHKKWEKWDG